MQRARGNKHYAKREFEAALREYTAALLGAPINDEGRGREAAVGLGNRSAVFFEMAKHAECLDDIDAAFLFGYPDDLKYGHLLE